VRDLGGGRLVHLIISSVVFYILLRYCITIEYDFMYRTAKFGISVW